MQTLPAHEIKRRGVAAIEEILDLGPIRILKHNRPACIVLSESEYQRLCRRGGAVPKRTAWEILLAAPRKQGRSREQIDAELGAERDGWDQS